MQQVRDKHVQFNHIRFVEPDNEKAKAADRSKWIKTPTLTFKTRRED